MDKDDVVDICNGSNTDGPGDYPSERSMLEKGKYHMISLVYGI